MKYYSLFFVLVLNLGLMQCKKVNELEHPKSKFTRSLPLNYLNSGNYWIYTNYDTIHKITSTPTTYVTITTDSTVVSNEDSLGFKKILIFKNVVNHESNNVIEVWNKISNDGYLTDLSGMSTNSFNFMQDNVDTILRAGGCVSIISSANYIDSINPHIYSLASGDFVSYEEGYNANTDCSCIIQPSGSMKLGKHYYLAKGIGVVWRGYYYCDFYETAYGQSFLTRYNIH